MVSLSTWVLPKLTQTILRKSSERIWFSFLLVQWTLLLFSPVVPLGPRKEEAEWILLGSLSLGRQCPPQFWRGVRQPCWGETEHRSYSNLFSFISCCRKWGVTWYVASWFYFLHPLWLLLEAQTKDGETPSTSTTERLHDAPHKQIRYHQGPSLGAVLLLSVSFGTPYHLQGLFKSPYTQAELSTVGVYPLNFAVWYQSLHSTLAPPRHTG